MGSKLVIVAGKRVEDGSDEFYELIDQAVEAKFDSLARHNDDDALWAITAATSRRRKIWGQAYFKTAA